MAPKCFIACCYLHHPGMDLEYAQEGTVGVSMSAVQLFHRIKVPHFQQDSLALQSLRPLRLSSKTPRIRHPRDPVTYARTFLPQMLSRPLIFRAKELKQIHA